MNQCPDDLRVACPCGLLRITQERYRTIGQNLTKPVEEVKPLETDTEITDRLMQDVHIALCKLSEHYRHLGSPKRFEVNKCMHILWKL